MAGGGGGGGFVVRDSVAGAEARRIGSVGSGGLCGVCWVRLAAELRRRAVWPGVVQRWPAMLQHVGEAAEQLSGCVVEHFREELYFASVLGR